MNIKLLGLFVASLLFFLSSCHHRTIKGNGNVTSEIRSVSNFNSVDVSAALKVVYTEGAEYKVEVIADDNLIKYITTEIHGDELQIGIQNRKSFKNVTKAEIHVTCPVLTSIEASGASSFEAINVINGGDLRVKLSGASTAKFNAEVTFLKGDLSGASNVTVSGTATNITFEGSGASFYNAVDLLAGAAIVNFSGASSGTIKVQNSLSASLSGASKLDYYGNPTVTSNSSGGSSLNKK